VPIRRSRVEPAGVLGDIVELQPIEHTARFASWKSLVERTGRVRRQVVEDDPDPLGFRIVHVSEVAHAGGKVDGSSAVGHFDFAPGTMGIREDE
jgi:hypothetical protein